MAAGRRISLGGPLGGHSIFLKFLVRHASYFDKFQQCVQNVIQRYFPGEKELKPVGFANTKKVESIEDGIQTN